MENYSKEEPFIYLFIFAVTFKNGRNKIKDN